MSVRIFTGLLMTAASCLPAEANDREHFDLANARGVVPVIVQFASAPERQRKKLGRDGGRLKESLRVVAGVDVRSPAAHIVKLRVLNENGRGRTGRS